MFEKKEAIQRWWDFPAAILLLAALVTTASRLVATRWTEDLAIVQTLVFFGVLAGIALGKSIFSPQTAFSIGFVYGAYAISWQIGMTLNHTLPWLDRLHVLSNRLVIIIQQLVNDEPIQDSLLFVVIMAIVFWTLSVHAGYSLVRYGNAWSSILPGGIAIFIIHAFDPLITRRSWYLAIYIFFSLILLARMVFIHRQEKWKSSRTALPTHLGVDFIRFSIIANLVVVLVSWTIPALANTIPLAQNAWQPVQRLWRGVEDNFENVFASLRATVGITSRYYGISTSLGRGLPLSDNHIFNVRAPTNLPTSLRLYWRARSYDTYINGQWFSTNNSNLRYDPEKDELTYSTLNGRWPGSFEFVSATHSATLYLPPQPVWISQAGEIEYSKNPDGVIDLSTFRSNPSLDPGQVYQVDAMVVNATQAQLKKAGTQYPEWVLERYLVLPGSITTRTRQLAADITSGAETPYDKTVAITDYLRKNIEYTETIQDELPDDQEIMDWFLFDYKQGFCNYYATAEVILLRAIGIPSRWVVGYAQGEAYRDITASGNVENIDFVVRQRNAHAWPEVYFPGIGWVEFEPTASEPDILRIPGITEDETGSIPLSDTPDLERLLREMEEEMALLRQDRQLTNPIESQTENQSIEYFNWLLLLIGGILIINTAWKIRRRIRFQPVPILIEEAFIRSGIEPPDVIKHWAFLARLPSLSKAYQEINKALTRLGKKASITTTPTERAIQLSKFLPEIQEPTRELVFEYEREIFGQQQANLHVAINSARLIRKQSIIKSIVSLFDRIRKPRKNLQ